MLDAPQIVQTKSQISATIRLTVKRSEIQQVMGPGFQELAQTLASQKIAPAGPFYSYHFRMDPEVFDFEIGVPVSAPVAPVGRVKPGELPAAKVARTVYHGPYEGLGPAWGEFGAWLKEQQLTPAENLWECYVSGPESSPDPSQWRTELNRPLKS